MSFEEFLSAKRSERERELVRLALANRETRVLFGMLLEESHFLAPSMEESEATHATAFREGQRIVGQRIFELLLSASDAKPVSCMREAARCFAEVKKNAKLMFEQEMQGND